MFEVIMTSGGPGWCEQQRAAAPSAREIQGAAPEEVSATAAGVSCFTTIRGSLFHGAPMEHVVTTNGALTLREITSCSTYGGVEYLFQMYRLSETGERTAVAAKPISLGCDQRVAEFMLWNSGLNSEFHNEHDMKKEKRHAEDFIAVGLTPYKYADPRLEAQRETLDLLLVRLPWVEQAGYVKALTHLADHIDSGVALRNFGRVLLAAPRLEAEAGEVMLDRGVRQLAPYIQTPRDLLVLYDALYEKAIPSGDPLRFALTLSSREAAQTVLESDPRLDLPGLRSHIAAFSLQLPEALRPDFVLACVHCSQLFERGGFHDVSRAIGELLKTLPQGLFDERACAGLARLAPRLAQTSELTELQRVLAETAPHSRGELLAGLAAAGRMVEDGGLRRVAEALYALHGVEDLPGLREYPAPSWHYLNHLKAYDELAAVVTHLKGVAGDVKEEFLIGLGNMKGVIRNQGVWTALAELSRFYDELEGDLKDFFRAPLRVLDERGLCGKEHLESALFLINSGDWREPARTLEAMDIAG